MPLKKRTGPINFSGEKVETKNTPRCFQQLQDPYPGYMRCLAELGASVNEINHALILLMSPIGFPAVSAALSWINDIVKN